MTAQSPWPLAISPVPSLREAGTGKARKGGMRIKKGKKKGLYELYKPFKSIYLKTIEPI
jgi:hypothetical protein